MRLSIPERACIRCRERRVKCDKGRPGCQRCAKRGLPCTGYDTTHRFLDSGAIVRERYGAPKRSGSDAAHASGAAPGLPMETDNSAAFDSRDALAPSEPGPSKDTAREVAPGSSMDPGVGPAALRASASSSLQNTALVGTTDAASNPPPPSADVDSMVALDSRMDAGLEDAYFDIDPDVFYGVHDNSCGFMSGPVNLFSDVDPWEMNTFISEHFSNTLGSPDTTLDTGSTSEKFPVDERTTEIAYLTMHFAEALGPWLDLFDEHMFFSRTVPARAVENALLRSCISAFASKQLGRLTSNKTFFERDCQKPAILHLYPRLTATDWFYKAASYYDKAIFYLRLYLQEFSTNAGPWSAGEHFDAPHDELDQALSAGLRQTDVPPSKKRRLTEPPSNSRSRDDLLIAVSILSGYEALDQHEAEMLQHLSGFYSLLTNDGLTESLKFVEDSETRFSSSFLARRATFWNFVRADCNTAYVNRIECRLDPANLDLWLAAGLPLTSDGHLSPQYFDGGASERLLHTEDLASRALLWILMQIMNFVANKEQACEDTKDAQATWDSIEALLDTWFGALPPTFKPYAHINHLGSSIKRSLVTGTPLTEVLFSRASCAAAMQLYHFGRILLLLNQPLRSKSQSTGDHMRLFREVSRQSEFHSREICGIAMGYVKQPQRTPVVQPLYLAGVCLEAAGEQRVVLDLLETIERDSGCATEYRRRDLQQQWGWEL